MRLLVPIAWWQHLFKATLSEVVGLEQNVVVPALTRAILRVARSAAFLTYHLAVFSVICGAVFLALASTGFSPFPGIAIGLLNLVIFPIAHVLGMRYLFRGAVVRAFRSELNQQGVIMCVQCGYDLRGQDEPRCPECGMVSVQSMARRWREGWREEGHSGPAPDDSAERGHR